MMAFAFNMANAQTYYYYSRTEYTYGPYYFSQSLNFIDRLIKSKEKKEEQRQMRERMSKQARDVRDYHASFDAYPDKVSDGWHSVVIVGGEEYIGDRKVLVEKSRVKRMVWDNWMEEELTFSGPIVEAMAGIRIKGGEGPLGGMVDVYFMNSLGDEPATADAPLKPGRVSFWTSMKDKELGKIYITFEDAIFGPFTEHRDWDKSPECGGTQQINVVYKPGIYSFKGVRKSSTSAYAQQRTLMEGKVEITEEGCTMIEIFEPGKRQKGPKK